MKKKMAAWIGIFMLILAICPAFSTQVHAETKVKIDQTTFPDTAFRNHIYQIIDQNCDGYLDQSELCLESWAIGGRGIKNLKGIEYFTSLHTLDCSDNELTSLDLSKNTELTQLYCSNNSLTDLNLQANPYLNYLNCSNNSLTSLDLSNNCDLITLICYGNTIPGLDISHNDLLLDIYHDYGEKSEDAYGIVTYTSHFGWIGLQLESSIPIYTSVTAKPSITKQPSTQKVKAGEKATFQFTASGMTSYQWYYRTSSSASWKKVSADSGKTANYSLTAQAKHDGYQYRCKVTNPKGSVYTSTRTLYVTSEKPAMASQAQNQTVAAGSTATFTVKATGGGLTYQWYYRTSSSDSWTKVSADSGKTASYSLTAQAKHNGYQYRCKVTNQLGNVFSYSRTLTVVTQKPAVTTQPANKSVKAGYKASFTVKASGQGLTYQWYYRTSSSGSWKKVSAASGTKATYSLTAQARHNGYQYRCKVTNALGSVYTKTVTLTVK